MEQGNQSNQSNQSNQQQYYQPQFAPSDNLSTFSTLHIVKGILTLLFSLFFLFYAFMGGFFSSIPEIQNDPEMPFNIGSLFIVIGLIGFVITVIIGILTLLTAKYIKEKRNHTFVFAISILNCLSGILGILLGVFTIIEINKPHIKAQFEENK